MNSIVQWLCATLLIGLLYTATTYTMRTPGAEPTVPDTAELIKTISSGNFVRPGARLEIVFKETIEPRLTPSAKVDTLTQLPVLMLVFKSSLTKNR
jgi:hypothetical protein